MNRTASPAARVRQLLWAPDGRRRVPATSAFDSAVSKLRRGVLEELCEFNPWGPIYFIPTAPFLGKLARVIGRRSAIEVAAGDGHLSRELRKRGVRIAATDSGKWADPRARMNAAERRDLREVAGLRPGDDVLRLDALEAIARLKPQLVLVSWIPPGPLLGKIIRASPQVLEIGAGSGITGDIRCWRYDHDFLDSLEPLARCRLDDRPSRKLHTTVTLYQKPGTPFRFSSDPT